MQITRRHVTLAIVAVGVSLAATAIVLKWQDNTALGNIALQLTRFPLEEAVVIHIDGGSLRKSGMLTPSKGETEPEYKQFLDGTGFDYRRDLESVTASISNTGNYFLVRGRFDWRKLHDYALKQGGSCYEELCRMPGSKPERRISFMPLREDYMALAVSTDDLAVTRLSKTARPANSPVPVAPVWLSLPGAAFRQQGLMPPGMRLTLSALTSADQVVVTVGTYSGGIEAHLEAKCRTKDDAGVLTSQLRNTSALIREGISNKSLQQDDEFARMLAAGTFDQKDSRVEGRWPVAKGLIESLTSGI